MIEQGEKKPSQLHFFTGVHPRVPRSSTILVKVILKYTYNRQGIKPGCSSRACLEPSAILCAGLEKVPPVCDTLTKFLPPCL